MDLKELEKKFHADGYQLGMYAAQSIRIGESIYRHVQQLHLMVDEAVDAFTEFAIKHNRTPDCKKGCSWCCYQPVFALSYELDYLKDYLENSFSKEEQIKIYARAESKRNKLRNLKGEALLNSKFPCPLLENNICMAYSARPVACRIYLSTDVGSCKKFYEVPERHDAVPALLDLPMRIGRMINEGFRAALKAGGFQAGEFRIEEFNEREGK